MGGFEMTPVPEGAKRGWTVKMDDRLVEPGIIVIESNFGVLTVGQRPEGWMGWAFRETAGGGAVTLPFAWSPEGELLVGLLLENRPNMGGGSVWCVAGGFVRLGETHAAAQERLAGEEMGLETVRAGRLEGPGINPNRLFFVADAATEGVKSYGIQLPYRWLEDDGDGRLKIGAAAVGVDLGKAADVRFFPWDEAARLTADGLACSAIVRLLAQLKRAGRNF